MKGKATRIRLGDLLKEAEIITSAPILDAVARFEDQGLPLGKVLVVSGYLTEKQLKAALQLQYMVNDGLLAFDSAVEVLLTAFKHGDDLKAAFLHLGLHVPQEGGEPTKIGQILIDADALDSSKLNGCLEASQASSLPLGHILCQRGLVSQFLINKALVIQQMVRSDQITRQAGIYSLQVAHAREDLLIRQEINKNFKKQPLKSTPLFGDLLTISGICTERQMRDALSKSIKGNTTIGESAVKLKYISRDMIDSVVSLQEMLDNNKIELETAKKALQEVKQRRILLIKAVAELTTYKLPLNQSQALVDLLNEAGLLDISRIPGQTKERIVVKYNQVSYVAESLEDLVNIQSLYSTLRAVDFTNRQVITHEDAVKAVKLADGKQWILDHALVQMGLLNRTRLHEDSLD